MPDTIDPTRRNMKQKYLLTPPPHFFWSTWKKNQSCPKLAEMARKLVENNFSIWGRKKCGQKIKVVPNWLTWRENLSEIISGFLTPPPQLGSEKNGHKNQTCSKLAKMARTLVRIFFF